LGWPFQLACDSYELGLAYLSIGEREKAIEKIDDSLGTFKTLGAKAYLERASAKRQALSTASLEGPNTAASVIS
jgi:hypothetical protein